ncbi:MAG: radical SAM protein [Dysgonamonadaceae bacterium]|jgi:radical SAM protein with 4Fe4S-binding SPASM domain|nr:radical SAM protein [Dysgonamonadaceae bacterium]
MKKLAHKIRDFFREMRIMLIDGLLRQGRQRSAPRYIIIEPTNICNLRCTCCPQGSGEEGRPRGIMKPEIFSKILKNIDLPISEICLYLHGEPFLNPDLDKLVEQIGQLKGVSTVIYTNGYGIDHNLLRKILVHKRIRISFSMDMHDPNGYEEIRKPAKFARAEEELAKIDSIFAECGRGFELSLLDNLECEREQVAMRLFKRYSRLRWINFGKQFPWPKFFYTGRLENNISPRHKICRHIDSRLVVFWNGDVSLCSCDYYGELTVGSLLDAKLSEIYNSPKARKIRRLHFFKRTDSIPLCRECLLSRFANWTYTFKRPKNEKLGRD